MDRCSGVDDVRVGAGARARADLPPRILLFRLAGRYMRRTNSGAPLRPVKRLAPTG